MAMKVEWRCAGKLMAQTGKMMAWTDGRTACQRQDKNLVFETQTESDWKDAVGDALVYANPRILEATTLARSSAGSVGGSDGLPLDFQII